MARGCVSESGTGLGTRGARTDSSRGLRTREDGDGGRRTVEPVERTARCGARDAQIASRRALFSNAAESAGAELAVSDAVELSLFSRANECVPL